MTELSRLAELFKRGNALDEEIGALIGRPALMGHVREFIAARIFGIALEQSATRKAFDGRFTDGPLARKSVNINWYAKQEGVLDIRRDALPDYYLVLAGPKVPVSSSRCSSTLPCADPPHAGDLAAH